jgi:hypothetical protein
VLGLDSQALAAFGAACVQHSAATGSCHTCAEAMGALAADDGRLVSTFHVGLASYSAKMGRIITRPILVLWLRHKTQQAVNPQLDLKFCLCVNHLGAGSRDGAWHAKAAMPRLMSGNHGALFSLFAKRKCRVFASFFCAIKMIWPVDNSLASGLE